MTLSPLAPHPSARLEYWFFKLNAGPVALLVDWIARRSEHADWLRLSLHAPGRREVLVNKHFTPGQDSLLTLERTTGQLGGISWQLDIAPDLRWIAPDIFPAGLLRVMDLSLVSAPMAVFNGWIRCDGETYAVHGAPGMLSHYWGRQLAPDWWWLSANQFDRPGLVLECCLLQSRLWGSPLSMPLAYFYLRQQEQHKLTVLPFALARLTGTPESFQIRIPRPGAITVTLVGAGRDFGDLGDGIINTLVGDLEIREGAHCLGRAAGTAGIEWRATSRRP